MQLSTYSMSDKLSYYRKTMLLHMLLNGYGYIVYPVADSDLFNPLEKGLAGNF